MSTTRAIAHVVTWPFIVTCTTVGFILGFQLGFAEISLAVLSCMPIPFDSQKILVTLCNL